MKHPLRKQLFRSAAQIVFSVLFLQLLLFTGYEVWEFHEHKQAYALHGGPLPMSALEYAQSEVSELIVLAMIGLLTLPCILVFCWYLIRRTLSPLEKIVKEITPVKEGQLEHRLSDYEHDDEIGVLIQAVNDALDRYRTSLEKQQIFAGNASHELRTPLAVIRAETEVTLSSKREVADYQTCLHNIQQETETLQEIVEQLLLLARMEPKSQEVEPVNLKALTNELIKQLPPLIRGKRVHLENRVSPEIITSSPVLLRLIFSNLLRNAVQVVPDGGSVILTSSHHEDASMTWTVLDSGPGLTKKQQTRVFERFSRTPGTRYPGAGLGLSIAADAAHGLEGSISIDSIDEMTAFSFRFPLA